MNHPHLQLDGMLTELGKAQSAGLFRPSSRASAVGGSRQVFPWQQSQTASAETPIRVTAGWRRVVRAFAVAACIAFVMLAVWRLESMLSAPVGSGMNANPMVAAVDVAKSPAHDPCDMNRDGKSDGEDIQEIMNSVASGKLAPEDARAMAACLVNP